MTTSVTPSCYDPSERQRRANAVAALTTTHAIGGRARHGCSRSYSAFSGVRRFVTTYLCACGETRSRGAIRCRSCEVARRYAPFARTCEHCGGPIKRKSHGTKDVHRFCSKRCGGAFRTAQRHARLKRLKLDRQQKRALCSLCGARCTGNLRALFCSDVCRQEWRRRKQITHSRLTCDTCGTTLVFREGHTRKRFCSAACRQRDFNTRETTKAARRIGKQVRRARSRGVPHEPVDPLRVFTRDHWHCQLCGCATPQHLRGTPSDKAPELDHIIPLGAGGSHTYANTQCTCHRCNHKKGAKPLGQLRFDV